MPHTVTTPQVAAAQVANQQHTTAIAVHAAVAVEPYTKAAHLAAVTMEAVADLTPMYPVAAAVNKAAVGTTVVAVVKATAAAVTMAAAVDVTNPGQ